MTPNYANLFATPENVIYVNNAAVGKIPRTSIAVMKRFLDDLAIQGEPPLADILAKFEEMRKYAGKLIAGAPENIAFMTNTSEGLSIALHSIPWQPGDNIIVQQDAFPASHYILEYSFPQIEKRYLRVEDGHQIFDNIESHLDKNTRALIFDHVNFLTGYRLDLKQLGELCQTYHIYSIIDGIQAAGAVEIGLESAGIDFFAAGGLKWLLSPMGTGLLFVRQEIIPQLKPVHVGWLSAQWEDFASFYPLKPLHHTARRFEWANTNLTGLYGFVESLKMFSSIGVAELERLILTTTEYLITELRQREIVVLAHRLPQHRSGIVSFRHLKVSSSQIFEQLKMHNVICSAREGYVRLAVHFYNTLEEMQEIIRLIDEIL